MMYTAVSERRCGSPLNNWMAETSRYDAYRGTFGFNGTPLLYRTQDELPFCIVVFSDKLLTGWFETHDKNLIQPALLSIKDKETALQS